MPSIIVLDDCLSAGTITQNINVIKAQFNAPVIYLTVAHARHPDQDQIILVCDDFILKPFTPEELKFRMQCAIRRYGEKQRHQFKPTLVERRQKSKSSTALMEPHFYIDKTARLVYIEGKATRLTPKEYALFCLFSENLGQIHSTEEIIGYLWPDNKKATPNDVQQFIYCLRKKIEKVPTNPCFLHNVPGYGYKLEYMPSIPAKCSEIETLAGSVV